MDFYLFDFLCVCMIKESIVVLCTSGSIYPRLYRCHMYGWQAQFLIHCAEKSMHEYWVSRILECWVLKATQSSTGWNMTRSYVEMRDGGAKWKAYGRIMTQPLSQSMRAFPFCLFFKGRFLSLKIVTFSSEGIVIYLCILGV